eukprot:Skav220107  [mRNA]  locus=scaffold1727:13737:16821:+ [translate_table: standard]
MPPPAMAKRSTWQASGTQLAERLERLLGELHVGGGAVAQRSDPVSAAEHAMRSMHLDPLVEDLHELKLLRVGARSSRMGGGAAKGSGLAPAAPLLAAVRQRLGARLEGILEAVERGRRESAQMLRSVPCLDEHGRLGRRSRKGGRSIVLLGGSENLWCNKKSTESPAEEAVVFVVASPEAWHNKSKDDIRELGDAMKDLANVFGQLPEAGLEPWA